MRIKILLELALIPMILSCKQPQTTEVKITNEKADRLLHDADSLIRTDSAFYNSGSDRSVERSADRDKEIRAKLDSAIQLAPHNKRSYIEKVMYLQQCYKYREVLPLLRQMEKRANEPMGADLRSLKGMLEDIYGDSITAQHDFLTADSAYAVLIGKSSDDSHKIAFRFNRAMNQSLMHNDFSILRKEAALSRNAGSPVKGTEQYERFGSKQEFYQYLLSGYSANHEH